MRNSGTAGHYNHAGRPNVQGMVQIGALDDFTYPIAASLPTRPFYTVSSRIVSYSTGTADAGEGRVNGSAIGFNVSQVDITAGKSNTIMPESADTLYGLYLGRPAEV